MSYDTIVIGGGIVGAAAAYNLAREGVKTLLVDGQAAGRATDAGAGIIGGVTAGASLPPSFYALASRAGDYYMPMISQLEAENAGDTGYRVVGELIIAADEDEIDAYDRKAEVIFARQRQSGLPSPEDLYEVTPEQAKEMFPALKTVLKALYFRGGARVDGRLLTAALLKAAANYGLTTLHAQVESLLIEGGQAVGVCLSDGTEIHSRKVIIAGGAWSPVFAAQLNINLRISPMRGQIIHFNLHGVDTDAWPIIEPFHGHYIVCWPDGRIVAGATREAEAGFSPVTTAIGVREVLSEMIRVAPGLASAEIHEMRIGLRPSTPDYLPVLGTIPTVSGVYLATGHGASGLLLGPYTGKLAADWARGLLAEVDIVPYSPLRWQ